MTISMHSMASPNACASFFALNSLAQRELIKATNCALRFGKILAHKCTRNAINLTATNTNEI